MSTKIWLKSEREKMKPRREPYWTQLGKGQHLGIRKGKNGALTWIAKFREPTTGARPSRPLGDVTEAFEFEQAKIQAQTWFDTCKQSAGIDPKYTARQAGLDYVEHTRTVKGEEIAAEVLRRFNHYFFPHPLANKAVVDIMAADLIKFRDAQTGRNATKNRKLQFVRAALRLAVRMRLASSIRMGEWTLCTKLKVQDGRRDIYLDMGQRRKLFDLLIPEIAVIARAAATTGARPGEIWHARRKQYEPRTGEMKFNGKTGPRKCKLSAAAKAIFDEAAKNKLPDAWLFPNQDGGRWKANMVGHYVRKALKTSWKQDEVDRKAGINVVEMAKGTCMYNFRHTFISDQIIQGEWDPLTVANYVGTSLEMIQKHYGHLRGDLTEQLARVQMI